MPAEQPQPPRSLPKYLVEGVPKQDDSALRDLQAWIDELIEYRTDISVDEIEVDKEERIEEVDDTGETTTVSHQEGALWEEIVLNMPAWAVSIRGSS